MLGISFSVYYAIQLFDISKNALLLKLIGVLACIGLNYYKDGENPNKIYGFVA